MTHDAVSCEVHQRGEVKAVRVDECEQNQGGAHLNTHKHAASHLAERLQNFRIESVSKIKRKL